jgi:phosphate:Na+ symporter
LSSLRAAVEEILRLTIDAYKDSDGIAASRVEPLEEVIDYLKETLKSKHIGRLQSGVCTVDQGIPYLEIIHNLEKIADHCSNVAVYIVKYRSHEPDFDIHKYLHEPHEGSAEAYELYFNKYARPII